MIVDLFDKESIDEAIRALTEYRDALNEKIDTFVRRLGEVGKELVEANISRISPYYRGNDAVVTVEYENGTAIITLSGKDVVFVEFGSGITFNTAIGGSLHPKGVELGLTIGSYNPDSPNAGSPTGWWFTNRWGDSEHTYGTPTFAPLHEAEMEIIRRVEEIAKEVFGDEQGMVSTN